MAFNIKKNIAKKHFYAVAFAALIVFIFVYFVGLITDTSRQTRTIYILPGATTESVGDSLQSNFDGSVASKVSLVLGLINVDWNKRVGAYTIESGTSVLRIARHLAYGAQTPIKFTFNNIRTLDEFAKHVDKNLMISEQNFRDALSSDSLLAQTKCDSNNIITIFLPDTYEFYWNVRADKFVGTMAKYYGKFWTSERLAKAKQLNLTPQQVSTLASIVEEETNSSEERGVVARLYLNRLAKGMRLQADPTVKFALGDFSLKRIGGEALKYDSPYNTYLYSGLPPAPIRFAEKKTIDAVLDSPMHNYIYMCAKEDFSGRHNFTASFAEHQSNARRYQAALSARGIK
ncbi:MAG: endolytic transglycosylase MltG [Muribaculaceae bacterium]|nr:endolytic transglycosylase MltG [Muribaculaceae bacterium]